MVWWFGDHTAAAAWRCLSERWPLPFSRLWVHEFMVARVRGWVEFVHVSTIPEFQQSLINLRPLETQVVGNK